MYLERLSIAILLHMDTIAIRIKESRKLREFSQRDLAKKVGVTPAAISQYESAAESSTEPSIKNLGKIAKILDVSFEWLATGRGVQGIEDFLTDITKKYKNDNRLVLLNKEQEALLKYYEDMPEDWKEKYLEMGLAIQQIQHKHPKDQ